MGVSHADRAVPFVFVGTPPLPACVGPACARRYRVVARRAAHAEPPLPTTTHKPPGIPVFPPHGEPDGDCVLRRLLADQPWRAEIAWPEGFAGGFCHRLDTSTSGALLLADDVAELAEIRRAFAAGEVAKTYRLRAARVPAWRENACDRPIAHDRRHARRMVVQRGHDTPHRGRWLEAHTRLLRLEGDLMEAVITTGVMHQIRVHAAFLGVPLLGDRLYGGGPTPEGAPDGVTFFLHHVGMEGPGWRTAAIGLPGWATLDL